MSSQRIQLRSTAQLFLRQVFWLFILLLFLLISFSNLLNPETKINYLIKRQKQSLIFD